MIAPLGLAAAIMLATALPVSAGCPVEFAVYRDTQSDAEVNFAPSGGGNAVVINSFRMLLDNKLVLDGVVMWTEAPERPVGMLMHKCPEGDVTGEELAKCTVWQGVIYTSDSEGKIGLLPAEGQAAPETLIFADLGPSLRHSSAYGAGGLSSVPFDVFALKGCQE
jgi:hypothetical protein